MWKRVWTRIKAFAIWVYDWITVLAALAVAGIPPLLAELDQLSGIDLAAVLPPEQAARIVATVAVVKVSAVAVVKVSALVAQRRARAAGGVP